MEFSMNLGKTQKGILEYWNVGWINNLSTFHPSIIDLFSRSLNTYFITFILTSGIIFNLQSQTVKCYTTEYIEQQQLVDPGLKTRMLAEEQKLSTKLNAPHFFSVDTSTVTIPVVVHIVYLNSTDSISDLRVAEQIQVFNEDFIASDPELTTIPSAFLPYVGNVHLQFCLAQRDPNDNPTTGITRTLTLTNGFPANTDVKFFASGGHDIWDRNKYLNIWVCKLTGGVVGYTAFPGSAANADGVVMDYRYFGITGAVSPYDKGKSATHEVGHWFNLKHIWGDAFCANDSVLDTPTQQAPNFGSSGNCPSFPHITCSNGPNGDMWMNYMDYGYDHCSYFFTKGQCLRMRTSLDVNRPSLKTSNGCQPVGINEVFDIADFSVYPNPTNEKLTINVRLKQPAKVQVNLLNVLGEKVYNAYADVSNSGIIAIDLNAVVSGVYSLELVTPLTKQVRKVVVEK